MDPVILSPSEIKEWQPFTEFPDLKDFKGPTRERMKKAGQWSDNQMAGKRWAIGCVSLEITQRCNLDCSLCYLSDMSEAVKDVPLQEVFRRIDTIYRHYGPGTDIQISGGDPTLRNRDELIQIVKRITDFKMEASLFTNGILARRSLIEDLAKVGLSDIAFHVDLTQERKGYKTEVELNEVRKEYIERTRGTGVNVMFNTTVFEGNFREIKDLTQFFCENAEDIQLVSFQLQADTGRGVLRERDFLITQGTVTGEINKGAGTEINFDVPNIGHKDCNKYGIALEANGKMYNFLDNSPFLLKIMNVTADFNLDRNNKMRTIVHMLKTTFTTPSLILGGLTFMLKKIWQMKFDLIKAKGKVNKVTFFVHNFMDAERLEKERCESCSFMVMTGDGPISMCVFNAKRDDYLLKAIKVSDKDGKDELWNPLTGTTDVAIAADQPIEVNTDELPRRVLKGRLKEKRKAEATC